MCACVRALFHFDVHIMGGVKQGGMVELDLDPQLRKVGIGWRVEGLVHGRVALARAVAAKKLAPKANRDLLQPNGITHAVRRKVVAGDARGGRGDGVDEVLPRI